MFFMYQMCAHSTSKAKHASLWGATTTGHWNREGGATIWKHICRKGAWSGVSILTNVKKGFCYLSFGLSPFPGTLGFQTPCEEVFEPQKTYRKKPTVALVHFLTIHARNFRRIFKKDGLEKVIYKRFFKHDCFGDFYVRLQRCSVDCLDVSWVVPLPSISGKLSFSSGSPNLKL